MSECPECNSKDVRVAIHTDYKECNKCFHFWEESDKNQREMTKIKIEAEFEIKDAWCAASPDKEEKDWFWNEVIPSSILILHSNEVGDNVSETKSFVIKKITFKTKER
jgi:hypothetical protein